MEIANVTPLATPTTRSAPTFTVIQRQEELDEPRVALGALCGLAETADPAALQGSDILPGGIPSHLVVYVETSLPPGSFAAEVLGPLGRGYHLLEAVPSEPREIWARLGEVLHRPRRRALLARRATRRFGHRDLGRVRAEVVRDRAELRDQRDPLGVLSAERSAVHPQPDDVEDAADAERERLGRR